MTDQARETEEADDVIRVHTDPNEIDAAAWDALLEQSPRPTPFMRHDYLAALHDSGCAVEDTGWSPCFVTLERHGTLVAAAPAYLKTHSYGEYVFDWAWADAYQRHGLRYYPKLLVAVPFTPVPGSRLLARDDDTRRLLAHGIHAVAQRLRDHRQQLVTERQLLRVRVVEGVHLAARPIDDRQVARQLQEAV